MKTNPSAPTIFQEGSLFGAVRFNIYSQCANKDCENEDVEERLDENHFFNLLLAGKTLEQALCTLLVNKKFEKVGNQFYCQLCTPKIKQANLVTEEFMSMRARIKELETEMLMLKNKRFKKKPSKQRGGS